MMWRGLESEVLSHLSATLPIELIWLERLVVLEHFCLWRSGSGRIAYGLAFYEYPELRMDGGCMHTKLPTIKGLMFCAFSRR